MLIKLTSPRSRFPIYVRTESVTAVAGIDSRDSRSKVYIGDRHEEVEEDAATVAEMIRKAEEATVARAQFTPGVRE